MVEHLDDHEGAEIHIGFGTDEHEEGIVLVLIHCPTCGNLEFQFPMFHFPGLVGVFNATAKHTQMPHLPVRAVEANTQENSIADVRQHSQERYNKRKH